MNKKNNNPEMQRKVIHNRKIDINCYARDDNLFDIEAKIVDVKPFKTISNYDFDREAYSPIHDMTLTVTINKEFMIKNVEAIMLTPAHESCHPASKNYKELIGIQIGPGWIKKVKDRVPINYGCTHLTEMLQQIGTTAFQGIFGLNLDSSIKSDLRKPFSNNFVDSCYGLRKDGYLLKKHNKKLNDNV